MSEKDSRRIFFKKTALVVGGLVATSAGGVLFNKPWEQDEDGANDHSAPAEPKPQKTLQALEQATSTPTIRPALKPLDAQATATAKVVEDIKSGAPTATPQTMPTSTTIPSQRRIP